MAGHNAGDYQLGDEHEPLDSYATATRWRHQESSKHARRALPRDSESRGGVSDLADFLNSSRISFDQTKADGQSRRRTNNHTPITVPGEVVSKAARPGTAAGEAAAGEAETGGAADGRSIACGPLLNYRRMEGNRWVGSVLIVTIGGGKAQPMVPTLLLRRADGSSGAHEVRGTCLYSDPRNTFWRFDLRVPVEAAETRWEYTLPEMRFVSKTKPQRNSFCVPAAAESMRIMFHSCNGFSVGTDEDAYSGACLWNDVNRCHAEAPFHVMIGGGDQIYNDGIRVTGPLRAWTDIGNPKRRRDHPFPESLRQACDDYYLKNYIRWSVLVGGP